MVDPQTFALIVQGPNSGGEVWCRGFSDAPTFLPSRVEVASDDPYAAAKLTEELWTAASRLGTQSGRCHGPSGTGCWATDSSAARNMLAVVATGAPPSSTLERRVDEWVVQRGLEAVGIVAQSDDPQVVLPSAMRNLVALRYARAVEEVSADLLDLVILGGDERRAFISYAHGDGIQIAQDVFESLARDRFDVYLDRFRTAPSADFVERIDDELRDKTMVVVVETPLSIASRWVMHEIATAQFRGYGLLALNIGGRPKHPMIGDGRRLSIPAYDDEVVVAEVERHYRAAITQQRTRRAKELNAALRHATRTRQPQVQVINEGDRCDVIGLPREYAVLGSFRPAGLRESRRIAEHGARTSRRPVVYAPRPTRSDARRDLDWIDTATPVAVVPDGRLLLAANLIAAGAL